MSKSRKKRESRERVLVLLIAMSDGGVWPPAAIYGVIDFRLLRLRRAGLECAPVSRRQFLNRIAAGSAGAALGFARPIFISGPQATSVREKLRLFRYRDVKLTGGPLKAQFDSIHAYYLAVDEDGLLKELRLRAGLPAPGDYLGGWYDRDGFAPGHCLGQLISALARLAEATADEATRAKAQRLAEGFAATIAPDGYCYPSPKASTNFPAYNYDKYVVGLLDAYQFAGVSSALPTLGRATRGAIRYMPPRALDRNIDPHPQGADDESYTLAENLFYAYEVTGENTYLDLAKKYLLNSTYLEPLSRGENVLPGRHAYSHCNALSSAARAYLVLGDRKYLEAIRNAWGMIEETQQFASGGWGPNEAFVEPNKGKLGESLIQTHAHFETPCGSYAHFKLARYLLRFTCEARYGDGLERVLYNTVLGAKEPSRDGHFFYYSDYYAMTQKGYFPDKWPCCAGTLPQVVADYLISIYFRSAAGIYVNLFVPSEVRWEIEGKPVRLVQSTSYPEAESTELRIEVPSPAEFTVYVRMPGWLASPASIKVNGNGAGVPAERGTFAAIHRVWRNNDTIEVSLPFSFRVLPVDSRHPNTVALMRGPLFLVGLGPQVKFGRNARHSPQALRAVPFAGQTYELTAAPTTFRFVPFYSVDSQNYTSYQEQV